MTDQKQGKKKAGAALPEQRRETYKGHEIIHSSDGRRKRLFIDGRPVHYGQAGDEYYLEIYAFDRANTLEEVVKRYLDYLDAAGKSRGKEG